MRIHYARGLSLMVMLMASLSTSAGQDLILAPSQTTLPQCEGRLTGHAVPSELVHDLGPLFVPHRQALGADTQVIGVALDRRQTSAIGGNDFKILDMKSGGVISDAQKLLVSANLALTGRSTQEVAEFEPRLGAFVPNLPYFVYSLATKWNDNYVILYDYRTGESHILARDGNTSSARMRELEIAHGRYVVSHYTDRGHSYYSFYDLMQNRNLDVTAELSSRLRLSADGVRLLETRAFEPEPRNTTYQSRRFELPQEWPARLELQDQAHGEEFPGAVIAASADLARVVVDRDNQYANPSYEHLGTPWTDPDLALVRLDAEGGYTVKGLAGWQPVLKNIREAAKQGLIIPVNSISGTMSEDGKKFFVSLEFRSKVDIQHGVLQSAALFEQNWIGLWDLNSGRRPMEITSKIFDSTGDQELNPALYSADRPIAFWNRRLATRMLPNGTLLVARSTTEMLGRELGNIHIKMLSFTADALPTSYIEHSTGPIRLDSTGRQSGFTGVRDLQIGASGRTLMFHIEGVGSRLVDLAPKRG